MNLSAENVETFLNSCAFVVVRKIKQPVLRVGERKLRNYCLRSHPALPVLARV